MSKEKGCECCKQIWYVDMLDTKLKLCPDCYEYCKPLFDDLKIKYKQIADLEAKLAEKEEQIKDAREAGNMAVDSWCKNRRKYEAQIAEMQNKSFILYSMLYETLEKQGCDNVASQIDQMTGWTYDKEVNWLKGNRNYDQLKQQLHDLPQKIVEDIRDCVSKRIMEKQIKWGDNIQIGFICNAINECLDAILEKYGDKNEN